jgi:hypothetical protein
MNADNMIFPFLQQRSARTRDSGIRRQAELVTTGSPAKHDGDGESFIPDYAFPGESDRGVKDGGNVRNGFREFLSNALEFDIGSLLQLKSFIYLLIATGLFIFQTSNTLSIISLSHQNEKLRNQIDMIGSVITSQSLKVHELQSIHNIAEDAAALGLSASSTPPVEVVK